MIGSYAEAEKDQLVLDLPKEFYKFLEPAPYKIAWGGRGGGKSMSIAKLLVYIGFIAKKKILCAREYQNTLKESSKALLEEQIEEMGLSWFYTITETEINGLNGTVFIFKGLRLNVGSLNSMIGIDICWLEEAQFNSKESIDALFPTIRKKGSEIWVSMNPRKADDPVYDLFLTGSPPEGTVIIRANYYDNPWFSETSLPAQMKRMKERDPAQYRHIWLGELSTRSDALVFTNWRVGRIEVPDNYRPFLGADWGYSVDPTVLTESFIFEDTNELYVRKEAYQHKLEIDDLSDFFDRIPSARRNVITADSARPELIAHLRKLNWRIQPSMKGKNSVIEGVEFLRTHDIVVDPDCTHTIEELEHYSWDVDKNGVILPNLVMENDHCIDSLRYAIETKRRGSLKVTVRNTN